MAINELEAIKSILNRLDYLETMSDETTQLLELMSKKILTLELE